MSTSGNAKTFRDLGLAKCTAEEFPVAEDILLHVDLVDLAVETERKTPQRLGIEPPLFAQPYGSGERVDGLLPEKDSCCQRRCV
jgi:hypothetical protein